MPTQTSQPWPWMRTSRAGYLRVSDAERNAVAERLGQHYAEGRLDQAEFNERVEQAMSAKTQADLNGLFDDLPPTEAEAVQVQPRPGPPRRQHRPRLLVLAAIILACYFAGEVIIRPIIALSWLWLLTLGVVLAVAALRRRPVRPHPHGPAHPYGPPQDS